MSIISFYFFYLFIFTKIHYKMFFLKKGFGNKLAGWMEPALLTNENQTRNLQQSASEVGPRCIQT